MPGRALLPGGPDPFEPSRWWAVCGGGAPLEALSKIPGGLWATEDCGQNWRRVETLSKQWYLTGLTFNPFRRGEVISAAADDPPFHGVYLYHTADGGKSWEEITDRVFAGELAKEKGEQTPVPYFVKEGVLIGTETGKVLFAEKATGKWRILADVPSRVTCFAADGQSPSSTMH